MKGIHELSLGLAPSSWSSFEDWNGVDVSRLGETEDSVC